MTDSEIVKEWEKVLATGDAPIGERFSCWITTKLAKETFDMLSRQKAEIERLQKTGEEAVSCFTRMESLYKIKCKELEVAKSEAYREFAERMKSYLLLNLSERISVVTADDVDKLLKELTKSNE